MSWYDRCRLRGAQRTTFFGHSFHRTPCILYPTSSILHPDAVPRTVVLISDGAGMASRRGDGVLAGLLVEAQA